jgi:hypothetical protein
MINKIVNILLDALLFVLLLALAPLVAVLITSAPVYGKVIGTLFIISITGASIFAGKQYLRHKVKKAV